VGEEIFKKGGIKMLEPIVFAQIVLAVVLGEITVKSIFPVAILFKKGVKAIARKIAD
jgi:hypothetical protein